MSFVLLLTTIMQAVVRIPELLNSLTPLVRIFDLIALISILIPVVLEGSVFYFDCCLLVSRARKVEESLQLDIDRCESVAKADVQHIEEINDDWNRTIRVHIKLIQCVCRECRDLREGNAFYLNILLIAGGLLLSITVKQVSLVGGNSILRTSLIIAFTIADVGMIGWSLFFCMLIESRVSRPLVQQCDYFL